jgi:uncharacterized protein YjbI with pentapeptide repeats
MKWFLDISLATSLAMIFASADAQIGEKKLTPAEKWVVAQAAAGEIADLSKQFPEEKDRKLSAHFLEDLLMGALPGVKPHRNGVRIMGAIIDEPIDLTDAQIPYRVWLDNCQFMSSATFLRTSFSGTILFDESTFKAEASFNSMKVGHDAFFRKAVFEGSADFVGVGITSDFVADDAQFKNKEQGADFNSMKVRETASFKKAVFEGPVGFGSADIVSNFEAQNAQFKNKEQGASFSSMKVGHTAFFTKAVFEGPVDFVRAEITTSFVADETQFKNKQQGVSFSGMKVGADAFFRKAVFEGPVNFAAADIGGAFSADQAQFKNKEQEATFDSMKVGHTAFFTKAVFEGPVDFITADFASNFEANEAQFKNKDQTAYFDSMKVGGGAFFRKAVFEGPVELSFSDFAALDLSYTVYHGALYLQAMNYKQIIAAPKEPESHEALLKLAGQSAYRADVYGNLEAFFLRQGYRDDADRAFIAGKRREREQLPYGLNWFGSWLLDWLVGYGRHPAHAGYFCAFFVALGCFLFSPKRMEPQKPDDAPRVYNRFWYSLSLFVPLVDLQAHTVWKPKTEETFLRNYLRVQILLGWILIPILLAAVTGLIK